MICKQCKRLKYQQEKGEGLKAILLVLSCHIIYTYNSMLTSEKPVQEDTADHTQTDKMLNKTQLTQQDTANDRQQTKTVNKERSIPEDTTDGREKQKKVSVVKLILSEKEVKIFEAKYKDLEQYTFNVEQQFKQHQTECQQDFSPLDPGENIAHKAANEQFPLATSLDQSSFQANTNNHSNSSRVRPIRSRYIIDEKRKQQSGIVVHSRSVEEGPPEEKLPSTNVVERDHQNFAHGREQNNAAEILVLDNAQSDRLQPNQEEDGEKEKTEKEEGEKEEAKVEKQIVQNVQTNRVVPTHRTNTQQLMHSTISDIFGEVQFYTEISATYFEYQCDDWQEQLEMMLDQYSAIQQ